MEGDKSSIIELIRQLLVEIFAFLKSIFADGEEADGYFYRSLIRNINFDDFRERKLRWI